MTTVWIVEAEHPSVPGRVMRVCGSGRRADDEAVELVRLMPSAGVVTRQNWQRIMERIQDKYGDDHAYVEISECEVLP